MHLLFKILIIIPLGLASSVTLPFRQIDPIDRAPLRERFPLHFVLPKNTGTKSKNFTLPYGYPEDSVDALIDFLPVEDRIAALSFLGRSARYDEAHSIKSHNYGFADSTNDYILYLVGNSYVEFDLLKMFLKFAYSKRDNTPLNQLFNAVSLVEYFREYSGRNFGHSLEFFSARMLIDWFELFKTARDGSLRSRRLLKLMIGGTYHEKAAEDIPPNALINLELSSWKEVLKNRLNRLLLTGYENIDL